VRVLLARAGRPDAAKDHLHRGSQLKRTHAVIRLKAQPQHRRGHFLEKEELRSLRQVLVLEASRKIWQHGLPGLLLRLEQQRVPQFELLNEPAEQFVCEGCSRPEGRPVKRPKPRLDAANQLVLAKLIDDDPNRKDRRQKRR